MDGHCGSHTWRYDIGIRVYRGKRHCISMSVGSAFLDWHWKRYALRCIIGIRGGGSSDWCLTSLKWWLAPNYLERCLKVSKVELASHTKTSCCTCYLYSKAVWLFRKSVECRFPFLAIHTPSTSYHGLLQGLKTTVITSAASFGLPRIPCVAWLS